MFQFKCLSEIVKCKQKIERKRDRQRNRRQSKRWAGYVWLHLFFLLKTAETKTCLCVFK